MDLTTREKRLFTAEEDRRELAEVGLHGDVECSVCDGLADTEAVTLMGIVYCPDCAFNEALRLRNDGEEWGALTRHDQVEALEIIETQARVERTVLTRRAS